MPVYLDHAASSPVRPEVLEEYVRAIGTVGNPSAIHASGQAARGVLEEGRARVAAALGADPVEVVLTSGGTEAVNTAVKGLYWRAAAEGRHRIVVTAGEHRATLDAVDWLEARHGALVHRVGIDGIGRVRIDELERVLDEHAPEVALVSALWASNEVGTLQPVEAMAALAARHGIPLHLDAIAALGRVPIAFGALADAGVAAVSVSGHKVGAPVGTGALLLGRRWEPDPLLHGGGQQRGRSGTQDAAGAAALGLAVELAAAETPEHAAELHALSERLARSIADRVPGAVLRGDPDPAGRLAGLVHVTVAGAEGESLLYLLDAAGFSVSTGAACQAGVAEPSHVLRAMGVPDDEARGALRFSLGRGTSAAEIDALLDVLPGVVARARGAAAGAGASAARAR